MTLVELFPQPTRETPSAPIDETFVAPTLLSVCCVCRLIRDETGLFPNRERWVTSRTYRKTYGLNPANSLFTHSYCPECFAQVMGTVRRHSGEIGSSP